MGVYTSTSTINIGTANEPLTVICAGPANTCEINYAGTSTAVILNGGSQQGAYGLEGVWLNGPTHTGTTTGLVFGGSNGANGAYFDHGIITGFGTGVQQTNNAWLTAVTNSQVHQNGQDYVFNATSNAGENLVSQNTDWYDSYYNGSATVNPLKCMYFAGTTYMDFHAYGSSADDCQIASVGTTTNAMVTWQGGHIENPFQNFSTSTSPSYDLVVNGSSTGSGNTNIFSSYGTQYEEDASTTSSVPNEFVLNGGIFVSTGDAAERAASTTANLATNQGPGKSVITAFTNENTAVTNITDGNAFKQPQPSYYTSAASSLTSTPDIFLGVTGGANSSSFISFDSGRTSIGYDGSNGYAVSQLASKSSIILSTNATSSQKIMSGAVSLKLNSSTATIGFSGAPLCFKGWDSVNSTTEEYIYSAASVLVATTTKPSFCQ